MMSLDNALWFAYIVTGTAVVGLLFYQHVWRSMPFFCAYCVWDLFSNVGAYLALRYFPSSYLSIYLGETMVDTVLQFAVLVELAWSVLRPLRASLPRRTLVVIAIFIVLIGAAIWPFAALPRIAHLTTEELILVHLQQTASILRILFFFVLAGCSQLLSISWRDRELQVATGLGFYSLVGVSVAMLNARPALGLHYAVLNQVVVLSYLCSLLYWAVCFTSKDAQRKEFTPQMQNFLLALAGTAQTTRLALTDSEATKARKDNKP
jgi:hypothetical protein